MGPGGRLGPAHVQYAPPRASRSRVNCSRRADDESTTNRPPRAPQPGAKAPVPYGGRRRGRSDGAAGLDPRVALPSSTLRNDRKRCCSSRRRSARLTGLGVAGFDSVRRGRSGGSRGRAVVARRRCAADDRFSRIAALCLRYVGRGCTPSTADEYLRAFHDPDVALEPRPLIARMLGGIATLAERRADGLEGPSLYLGASIGDIVQRRFPNIVSARNRRLLLVAGAAAGVAAIFKAPATGAVFAVEVPYQDDLAPPHARPGAGRIGERLPRVRRVPRHRTALRGKGIAEVHLRRYRRRALLGVFAGAGARVFVWMLRRASRSQCRSPTGSGYRSRVLRSSDCSCSRRATERSEPHDRSRLQHDPVGARSAGMACGCARRARAAPRRGRRLPSGVVVWAVCSCDSWSQGHSRAGDRRRVRDAQHVAVHGDRRRGVSRRRLSRAARRDHIRC